MIRNLEKKLKYGIEIVVKETLYEKNYPEIIKTINECVGDINKIFINQNSQALVSLLSRNIGKEMALLEKLCEENKEHLNQLFNIDYYVKELKKANGKIESQIYYQVIFIYFYYINFFFIIEN